MKFTYFSHNAQQNVLEMGDVEYSNMVAMKNCADKKCITFGS